MRLSASVAAVSCKCPLLLLLCVVFKSCHGDQLKLGHFYYPIPSQTAKPGLVSLPEPVVSPTQRTTNPALMDRLLKTNLQIATMPNYPPASTHLPSALSHVSSLPIQNKNLSKPVAGIQFAKPSNLRKSQRELNPKNKSRFISRFKSKLGQNEEAVTTPTAAFVSSSKPTFTPNSGSSTFNKPRSGLDSFSSFKSKLTSNLRSDSKSGGGQSNQTQSLPNKDFQQRPKRGWIWNQFFVLEEQVGPVPQYVGKLHSNSDKSDGTVRYTLSGEGAGSIFIIDETTGDINAAKSLDRESKSQYVLHARAIDRRTNLSLEAESEFIIKVQDVNDNAPTFPDGPFSATVPEMSDVGTSVLQVSASDADDPTYGNSAKIVYSILEGKPYFSIDPKTGVIRTAVSNMDRETSSHYSLLIQAKDMAGSIGGLSGSTTVNVTLSDVNDNAPKFSQKSYQLYVPELAPIGKAVGRIKANDEDEGQNAEMTYRITNAEAAAMFTITTDEDGREGIISIKQPLNYEKKKVHTLNIEGSNTHPDPRFSHLGQFRDTTMLRVIVGDVDEPPVFTMNYYIMDIYENSPAGTQVGTVTALDPDSTNSEIRYFIENNEARPTYFTIGVNSGLIRTTQTLDREETAWHNISVMAAEVDNPRMVNHVAVTIQVLDMNDNVPTIAGGNSAIVVCESTKPGQVIQTLRASDRDDFANGKFSFSVPADHQHNPNFTVKDNGDNTASIISVRRSGFSQDRDQKFFSLVLVVADGGEPQLSSTATLSLRVCVCQKNIKGRGGNVCQAQAFLSSAGLSTGAFVAILLCILILLAIVMLFTQLRSKKASKEPLIISEEDIRENVVTYDDEGGGEEDTEAFDMTALRNPKAAETHRKFHSSMSNSVGLYEDVDELELSDEETVVVSRRKGPGLDYNPESEPAWFVIDCLPEDITRSARSLIVDDHDIIQRIIGQKVATADLDTRGPPYDSLQTYAYEGRGSLAGSVSSLGLTATTQELFCVDLEDWESEERILGQISDEQLATMQDNSDF
ncbi:cadherin-18-like isoform 1-T2 [Synchiropus picturatus]